eukprot:CAMPEP_0171118336 /NCGR_PEP_ID=MMETSP0766_2-20121228/94512_1 /TAXON_ID=439317 /ORGANISM="Gambierdiscus australes, Strain CAWD 149" /LENGTH=58 /DNA_ID=CAMNT_0011580909 /DNA_START=16 /DNA_END=189 /DNA_ORIENTATION=+
MVIGAALIAAVRSSSAENPFLHQEFYVNPVNSREFESSIATAAGDIKVNLKKMQKVPS